MHRRLHVMLLMQMLADGEPLPALACVLEETVRNPGWRQGVRSATLDVLTGYAAQGRLGFDALAGMVAEIHEGRLDDPQDELLGILLKALYPEVLSVAEALRYLRTPKLVDTGGEYSRFWVDHVPRESAPEQLADLLDGIVARFEDFRPFMVRRVALYTRMGHLPVKLLKQTFRGKDAEIAPDRLYDWLGVVSDPGLGLPESERRFVGSELRWNQDALKALISRGVERSLETGEDCSGLVDRRLFGARPFDYAPWCLEMALGAEDGRAASFYLGELLDSVADLELVSKGQCFPRYRYERPANAQAALPGFDQELEWVDNIHDTALRALRTRYNDDTITKDRIFDYVYGILHAPDYRERFASDLAKGLPRVPHAGDFHAFADAGRALSNLHLGYERRAEYPLTLEASGDGHPRPEYLRLGRRAMRFKDDAKSILELNEHAKLTGIPGEAHEYQVNGRTPLEWFIDRYRIVQDKESGIVNDPNGWFEHPCAQQRGGNTQPNESA